MDTGEVSGSELYLLDAQCQRWHLQAWCLLLDLLSLFCRNYFCSNLGHFLLNVLAGKGLLQAVHLWTETCQSYYLSVWRLNTRVPYLAFFKLDRFSFSALDFSMFSRSWGHSSSSSSSASSPTSSSDDSSIVLSSPAWEGLPSISAGSDSSKMSSLGNGGGSFTKTVAGISFSSWRTQEKSLSQLEKMDRCNSRWMEVYYVTGVRMLD